MNADMIFVVLLALLGAGGLGGMMAVEVSRLGVLSARRSLVQKRTTTLRAETEQARARTVRLETAIERGQAHLAALAAECLRLTSLARTVEADRVEVVHDLGTPDGRPAPYRCVLRTVPDFARIDPRHVVLPHKIWQRKNVAHVWAETPELAYTLLQRAFPARSGVLPGAIERVGGEPVSGFARPEVAEAGTMPALAPQAAA